MAGEDAPRAENPREPQRRSGFWPLVLGGVVAAGIGAGAVLLLGDELGMGPVGPDPATTTRLDETGTRLDETGALLQSSGARLDALERDVASLGDAIEAPADNSALEALRVDSQGQFVDLTETLGGVADQLEDITARLERVEARPVADPDAQSEMLREEVQAIRDEAGQAREVAAQELEAMRAEISQAAEAARGEVETMRSELTGMAEEARAEAAAADERRARLEAEAASAVRATEARAALSQVAAAIDNGTPFADALANLREKIDGEIPQPLPSAAETGVPTLSELRRSYPAAARAALAEAAVAQTEGDPVGRLTNFLKVQTQARSLAPRAGDDADAILSRAEAALNEGEVRQALEELRRAAGRSPCRHGRMARPCRIAR